MDEAARGDFVKRLVHDVDFVGGKEFGLYDVDFLFYLLDHRADGGLVGAGGDGVAVNVLDARGRHVEAFYVELAAREDVGDGVEHAGQVFREYDDGIKHRLGG